MQTVWRVLSLSICCLCGCFLARRIPDSIEPKVLIGEDLLEKRLILDSEHIGGITDILAVGNQQDRPESIIVAGTQGAVFLDPSTYDVQRTIEYNDGSPPSLDVRILDIDGDGVSEFLRVGKHWARLAELYDGDGKTLWQYMRPVGYRYLFGFLKQGVYYQGFVFTVPVEIEDDGSLGVLMGFTDGEVHLVDRHGKPKWVQEWAGPFDIRDVHVLDGRDSPSALSQLLINYEVASEGG